MYVKTDSDLLITYSWDINSNQGVCGHTFEVIEYFWILKDYFNVKILIAELDKETFLECIHSKYNFTEKEIQKIIECTIFSYKPKIVMCNNILFTDGGIPKIKRITIKAKNKFIFSCTNFPIDDNFIVLEDQRVYGNRNSVHYIKKILFSRFKKIETSENKTLVYMTSNCRSFDISLIKDVSVLAVVNEIPKEKYTNVEYAVVPVKNLMEKFNKYIYTPVPRKWDCSSRFIPECKYYNKQIEYFNIDYLDVDVALKYRIQDSENLCCLNLDVNDNIISILKDYI